MRSFPFIVVVVVLLVLGRTFLHAAFVTATHNNSKYVNIYAVRPFALAVASMFVDVSGFHVCIHARARESAFSSFFRRSTPPPPRLFFISVLLWGLYLAEQRICIFCPLSVFFSHFNFPFFFQHFFFSIFPQYARGVSLPFGCVTSFHICSSRIL